MTAALCALSLIALIVLLTRGSAARPGTGARIRPPSVAAERRVLGYPHFAIVMGLLLIAQFLDRGLGLLIPLRVAHMPGVEAIAATSGLIISVAAVARDDLGEPRRAAVARRARRAIARRSGSCSAARSARPWPWARAGSRFSSCARSPACASAARSRLPIRWGASSSPRDDRGAAFGWLALGVQVGTAISPLATGALAAVSLPGAFVLSGIMAWVAAALLFFGSRGLLSRRADAPA